MLVLEVDARIRNGYSRYFQATDKGKRILGVGNGCGGGVRTE